MAKYRLCKDTPHGNPDCDVPLQRTISGFYCCPHGHGLLMPECDVWTKKREKSVAEKWKKTLPSAKRRGTYQGKVVYEINGIPHVVTGSTDYMWPIEPGEIAATIRSQTKRIAKTFKQISLPERTMARLRFIGLFQCDGQ